MAVCALPGIASGATVSLRFAGTADLTQFGAPANSTFSGTVAWDPLLTCGPGPGEGDFVLAPLEGEPPCVTATLAINSIGYQGQFDLELSRLMLFPNELALELWFAPPVDLDGAGAPDLVLAGLSLSTPGDPDDPVFADVAHLPSDLSFLRSLTERSIGFSGMPCWDESCSPPPHAESFTLTVVPEPAATMLVAMGVCAAGLRLRRSRTR